MRLNVTRSRDSLTSVVASALLNVSRSSRPISPEAARASMASLGEMRISARLRSPMNSRIRWSIFLFSPLQVGQDLVESARDAVEVPLGLDEHGQGGLDQLAV